MFQRHFKNSYCISICRSYGHGLLWIRRIIVEEEHFEFSDIFNATAVVGGMGIAIGLLLGLAGRVFQVETDEREELVLELLQD